ncbi:MAG: hypothetical protein ABIP71_16145 [Verrucomicrobiota bacterium]
MNSKNAIPWILALIVLAAAGFLFVSGKNKETELVRLRSENSELPVLRTATEEAQRAAQNSEQPLNTKEREELIRLRNEVGQLRRDKLQTMAQLKQVQQNQEQLLERQQAQQVQLQQQNQQIAQQIAKTPSDEAKNACINQLRQFDGAKQQWALENKQPADALVVPQQITPYLKNATLPPCPSGGTYTLNNVNQPPTCSIPGHVLPP